VLVGPSVEAISDKTLFSSFEFAGHTAWNFPLSNASGNWLHVEKARKRWTTHSNQVCRPMIVIVVVIIRFTRRNCATDLFGNDR
jgi:hypothetical protein